MRAIEPDDRGVRRNERPAAVYTLLHDGQTVIFYKPPGVYVGSGMPGLTMLIGPENELRAEIARLGLQTAEVKAEIARVAELAAKPVEPARRREAAAIDARAT